MKMIDTLKDSCVWLSRTASSLQSIFLLGVRLTWGTLFFKTGLSKITDIDPVVAYFDSLGIPLPEFSAHLVAWTETIGGACLVLGFASRLVSIPLAICMLVAFLVAHFPPLKNALQEPTEFFKQSPFTFLFASLLIFVFGPGKVSLDYFFEKLTKTKID